MPKERFPASWARTKLSSAAYDGAVGKVEQFIEILLCNERDFDQGNDVRFDTYRRLQAGRFCGTRPLFSGWR